MKKLFFASTLISTTLFLSGCKQTAPTSQTPTPTAVPETANEMSMSDMKAIAEASVNGTPVSCMMTHKTTGKKTALLYQNTKLNMRAEGEDNKITRIISDGQVMYTWDESTKQGTKLSFPDPEEMKKQVEEMTKEFESDPAYSDPELLKATQAASEYTTSCKVTSATDADFVPPSDVTFQDLSTQMNDAVKKAQEGMTDDQKKQMEEMMKKYGN